MTRLNRTLEEAFGISSIHDIGRDKLQGLMTGSIDLLFIHKDKIYILDYKSNSLHRAASTSSTTLRNQTLDAALGFYQPERLQDVMRHEHYDLQSAIYSVAAHRFMQQRSPGSYHFDHGHYQFGGVIYLFLRGMGVKGKEQYGIYFSRPSLKQVNTLDSVLMGEDEPAEVAAHG